MSSSDTIRFVGVGELPRKVPVRIEVPRGSFVKRRPSGALEFVSPLPCPYDYGSVVGTTAPDGDPLDALVLGSRSSVGATLQVEVQAVMGFVDLGVPDPKLVCAQAPLTPAQERGVERFFAMYASFKKLYYRLRGERGPVRVVGWLHRID